MKVNAEYLYCEMLTYKLRIVDIRDLHNTHRNCLSGSADAYNRSDEVPSSFPSHSLHAMRL